MPRLAAALTVVGAALALSGCGGGSEGGAGDRNAREWLSTAATASAEAWSGRFAVALVVGLPEGGEPAVFAGGGTFDRTANWARYTVDYSGLANALFSIARTEGIDPGIVDTDGLRYDVVQDGYVFYVRSPALAGSLPAGKSWLRADVREGTPDFDFALYERFGWYDRRGALGLARTASGAVEVVGEKSLRGESTTRVRTSVDLGDYEGDVPEPERGVSTPYLFALARAMGASELALDLWVDERDLVRRLVASVPAADGVYVRMTYELHEYGKPVDYGVPPASEVAQASRHG